MTDPVRIHFGMSGTVPLQLYEFVFEETGCFVFDCGAFTPLFGLMTKRHLRRAARVDEAYDRDGVAGVAAGADTVTWVAWDAVDRLVLHTGGRFTRPKLTLETTQREWAVRLYDVDTGEVSGRLSKLVPESVPFEHVEGGLR